MVTDNWKRTTSTKVEQCWECQQKIWIGDEYYSCWTKNPWCIQCRESRVKQKSFDCFSELRQLRDDLEPKVENENLEVRDVERIYDLKSEIYEVLKTPNIKDFGLTYPTVETDFKTLNKVLTDLDDFLKENASPQIQDRASSDKSRRNKASRECYHENVEPYEDDPTFYCCSYCWNDSDERFLNTLKWFHQNNIEKWVEKHNLNSTLKITSKLSENFTTQDQLKQTYQEVAQELNQLAKSKGINDPIEIPNSPDPERERERERERSN